MIVYSYTSSVRAYRGVVQAEGDRLAREMRIRLADASGILSASIQHMRERPRERAASAFAQARQDALAAAQHAELRALVASVLATSDTDPEQIAFAKDAEGRLYAANAADLSKLYGLGLAKTPPGAPVVRLDPADWVVATRTDEASGMTVGVAGPLDAAVREMRGTAVRNLGYGLAMVLVAFLCILPLVRRLTRDLDALTAGVARLGAGEKGVEVGVPRGEELARLARAFNAMARDLEGQQQRLLAQERLHKELEISRRIQEELLPREPGRFAFAEAAGLSIPAREVGGDFFNYFSLPSGEAVVLIGDVSGKGVPAAILMANLQATLRARLFHADDLAALATQLDEELGASPDARAYVTLFLAIVDGARGCLRYVNAGHNTQLLLRDGGPPRRLESSGRPVGLLPGGGFEERTVPVMPGDALLLFTDGLLDAESPAGEAFGMERLEALVAMHERAPVAEILARLDSALRDHRAGAEAGDDATIVALQVTAARV